MRARLSGSAGGREKDLPGYSWGSAEGIWISLRSREIARGGEVQSPEGAGEQDARVNASVRARAAVLPVPRGAGVSLQPGLLPPAPLPRRAVPPSFPIAPPRRARRWDAPAEQAAVVAAAASWGTLSSVLRDDREPSVSCPNWAVLGQLPRSHALSKLCRCSGQRIRAGPASRREGRRAGPGRARGSERSGPGPWPHHAPARWWPRWRRRRGRRWLRSRGNQRRGRPRSERRADPLPGRRGRRARAKQRQRFGAAGPG